MHLTIFFLPELLILLLHSKFKTNDVILINHGSFFQEKDFLQLKRFQISKIENNKIYNYRFFF